MRAIASCFGDDPDETVEIIIGQLVTLHGGRMSKRAGNLVTLDEAIALIGTDAAAVRAGPLVDGLADRHRRGRLGRPGPTTTPSSTSSTRTPGWPRSAATPASSGISVPPPDRIDYGLLSHEREGDLLRALGEFPRVVAAAAELRAPHRVARYLEELAGTYHRFYDACRVLPSEHDDSPGPDLRARPARAVRGDPDRAGKRPRPDRRLRARPDVT